LYYARIPEGKDYTIYLRKPCQLTWFQNLKKDVSNFMGEDDEENWGEQKLLDMNELVKGRGKVFKQWSTEAHVKDSRVLS
jgi:hypothetical protein